MTDRRRRPAWRALAARAQASPGVWIMAPAMVPIATPSQIRRGRIAAFRPVGDWAARYEQSDQPGQVVLFVKFTPGT